MIQEDIIETHLKQTPDLGRKQAHLCRYRFSKVYRSAVSGFLKNCDGNFLIGDDLQLRCRDLMSLTLVLSVVCEVVWREINREGEV